MNNGDTSRALKVLMSTGPAVFLMLSYRRDALTAALYDAQT